MSRIKEKVEFITTITIEYETAKGKELAIKSAKQVAEGDGSAHWGVTTKEGFYSAHSAKARRLEK